MLPLYHAMRHLLVLLACITSLASTLDAQESDSAQAETPKATELTPANLTGTWAYISGSSGGEKIDPTRLEDQLVVFADNTLTLKTTAGDFVMDYKIDAKKSPAALFCKITSSPFGDGSTINGIIELGEKELKICYAHEGDAPVKFTSDEDVNHRLLVLKRKSAE